MQYDNEGGWPVFCFRITEEKIGLKYIFSLNDSEIAKTFFVNGSYIRNEEEIGTYNAHNGSITWRCLERVDNRINHFWVRPGS